MQKDSYTLDSLHGHVAVYCSTDAEVSSLIDAVRAHERREDKWFKYRNELQRQRYIKYFIENGYSQEVAEKHCPPGGPYFTHSQMFALDAEFCPSAPTTISLNQVTFEPCAWVLRFRARPKTAYEKAGFDVINFANLTMTDYAMESGFVDD